MLHAFSAFIADAVSHLDYAMIFFLMTLESSVFPVPSEAVMIPAGYLVATGKLSHMGVFLAGVLWSIAGASLNYLAGAYLGKPFLMKYGKYLFISPQKYAQAEALFLKNDALYTFLGRLIPVIRHLISLPAGVFRMKYPVFLAATATGAALWVGILQYVGYAYGQEMVVIFESYTKEIGYAAIILFAIWIIYFMLKKK